MNRKTLGALLLALAGLPALGDDPQPVPKTGVPQALRDAHKLDPFYQKHVDARGLPVLSSAKVSDAALLEAAYLINQMLADREDIRQALIKNRVRFVVMAPTEMTTDVPEQRHMTPKDYWDKRARGLGGRVTSCGEENLLNLKGDRYRNENILIHEFSHAIHNLGLRTVDPKFDGRLRAVYARAMEKELWKKTYAATNAGEYWAEGVQSYFDCNAPAGGVHNDVNTREKLAKYDPELFALIDEVFKQSKWRYVRYDRRKPPAGKAPGPETEGGLDDCDQTGGASGRGVPVVTAPPESFFQQFREKDREAARKFYKKHVDVKGLAVAASAEVADEALQRTHHIVSHMLAGRPDILDVMAQNRTRLIIIGKDQVYTDMPEYRNHPNPAYQNERVRGTGGLAVTSFGEENLLNLPLDRYDDESIGVHEFCHTIDAALGRLDPTWRKRLGQTYRNALDKGLWKNAYAASNQAEYWAELCQSYFDCNRINNWNHASIATREQLKLYDPEGYELVRATFRLTPEKDWRYQPLRAQPSVIPPPARFKIDPYYTKFTWAREFTVLGSRHVRDEALLKANDTIRKLFAYRHDLLKALIADGVRLVVLGRHEKLSDLPECKDARSKADFDEVRYLEYTPTLKLLVVPEENVLGLPGEPFAGKCMVVSLFAKALHQVAGLRPVDPNFEKQRSKQQYELRVKRLDITFDHRLRKIHEEAGNKGLWKGTPAWSSRAEYWAAGVEAYFDAAGKGLPPNLADRPVTTRAALKAYDPELFALVEETMAYTGHVDWRFER